MSNCRTGSYVIPCTHVPTLACSSFNRFSRLPVTKSMTNCPKRRLYICGLECAPIMQFHLAMTANCRRYATSGKFPTYSIFIYFQNHSHFQLESHKQIHYKEARLYVCPDKFKAKAKVIQVAKTEGGVAGNPPSVCQHFVSYFLLLSKCFASLRLFRH